MFEVCIDDRSVSRLALVWLPPAPPARREVEPDSRAANLLFAILDGGQARLAKARPKSRRRKPAKVN